MIRSLCNLLTRRDARLRRQHSSIRAAIRCRSEKAWVAARRDIVEVIYGSQSREREAARQDYAIVSWGHSMVGPDGDVETAYPIPTHLVTVGKAEQVKAILERLICDREKLNALLERELKAPLDTSRF